MQLQACLIFASLLALASAAGVCETLVKPKGLACDEHYATTTDGYVLNLQYIPPVKKSEKNKCIFLQHGFIDASSTWVVLDSEKSLAAMAARAGFHVWMGNNRGNKYSSTNVHLATNTDAFWSFSWDEFASIDLPTMLQYANQTTLCDSLTYVGHSQGSTQMFAQLSQNPSFAENIDLFIAVGPVAKVFHANSTATDLLRDLTKVKSNAALDIFGEKEFLPSSKWVNKLAGSACEHHLIEKELCVNLIALFAGPEANHIDPVALENEAKYGPGGTSVKDLEHWAQGFTKDAFQAYDYGSQENVKRYGSATPKAYDMRQIRAPVALFAGMLDELADPIDVDYIRSQVPTIVHDVTLADYGHLDFVWGSDAHERIYPQILSLAAEYA